MTNLMIHAGAHRVDREQLNDSDQHMPVPTATHTPIPHHFFLEQVASSLKAAGYKLVSGAHALTSNGQRYFGLLELNGSTGADDYSLVVGLRNAHDKRFPAGLAVGSSVFVCDNLAFSSEIVIARRHTRYILRDLPGLVDRAVGMLGDLRTRQHNRYLAYKEAPLADRDASHLLVQALRARVFPVTKMDDVIREWYEPSHEEFAAQANVWRLFNAVTEALKGRLGSIINETRALHGICDSYVGLPVIEGEIVN
jgi:hypothetical protein